MVSGNDLQEKFNLQIKIRDHKAFFDCLISMVDKAIVSRVTQRFSMEYIGEDNID